LVKEQCFQFGVKELRRDGKGRGLSSFVGWVRYLVVEVKQTRRDREPLDREIEPAKACRTDVH